jgi:hypothetical protein
MILMQGAHEEAHLWAKDSFHRYLFRRYDMDFDTTGS